MNKIKKAKNSLLNNEQGVVSLLVSIVIMLLLSLIVVAMSQNSNRERRQALDRQLNSQAFYAAESGINEVLNILENNPGDLGADKSDCDPTLGGTVNNVISPDGAITFTCVLYDTAVPSIIHSGVGVIESVITPIRPASGTINNLVISFEASNHDGTPDFGGCPANNGDSNNFVPQNQYQNCDAGVLRAEIIRESNFGERFVVFISPSTRPSSATNYNTSDHGVTALANCDGSGAESCSVRINGLPNIGPGSDYYLVLRSLYKPNDTNITSNNIEFVDSQIEIDVTGKANDVLKRLLVRKPIENRRLDVSFPVYGSDQICKRIEIGSEAVDGC